MKYFFSILLFTSFNLYASECEIELFSKIYRLNANQALQARDLVKDSTCSPEISNKLASLVSSSEGTVGSDFLKSELQKEFSDVQIHFTTKKLSLLDFNAALRDQLIPDSNLYFSQARSLNGITSLGLSEGEQMRAVCDSCQSFGEKNIKIDVANVVSNTSRTLWFSSKIMAKVKVVKAKRNISFQQKTLDANDFYFEEVMTMTPENALTTLDNIGFYKSNKTIVQNAVVSNLDLQAVNLINYGTPVSVTLVSQSISLQKTAMPLRSAHFGEVIELKGPNNKNIAGKVVDFNKVVIEL
ncbi:flagella basal body P-ring formation protein FlgA [Bacteriovorax sp. PP10]|uniref:Flagella basal body P-ring formation protein FlgA n=1 Tax=Bacteriovorax antarcticus TaxID=3088717 RepID=A0ABU5VPD4_9BACT|nr:flagella basal body P-ring formation protein FlgA [Bacteriovorax sp. PP10]MEA9354898.1 flagella basal body P-ring formation protein FlgA [Bacteriovorax sp. PP10]